MKRGLLFGLMMLGVAVAPAAHTKEDVPTKGKGTVNVRVTVAATTTHKTISGSGQDKLAVTFTEVQQLELLRYLNGSNSLFAPRMVSYKNNIAVSGGGKFIPKDPNVQRDVWQYQVDQQPEEDWVKWYTTTMWHLPNNWFTCPADLGLSGGHSVAEAHLEGGGGLDAAAFAENAWRKGSTPFMDGLSPDDAKRTPPPLEFCFNTPEGMVHQRTFTAHKVYTLSGTADWDKDITGSATITIDYSFEFEPPAYIPPKEPDVQLQEIDQKWLPEESNSLTATATVTGDKQASEFRFTLYDVSSEPGKCCNSDDKNTDADLSFSPGQPGWDLSELTPLAPLAPGQSGSGGGLVATSEKGGKSATITIASHDWGAWGKLKAEAKISGKWKPAKVSGTGLDYVRIPYDDDDDHIADAWQADEGVGGKSATDDSGKEPKDQVNDGDGLSVYEDYRGCMVLGADMMPHHQRLKPKEKALFVLDLSGYFEPAVWKQCSGITAYLVAQDGTQVKTSADSARLINFRSSNAKNGDKYGVVVSAVRQYRKGDKTVGLTASTSGAIQSPKDVDFCRLYPDVMEQWILDLADRLQNAYDHPGSADGKDFGDPKPGPDGQPTNPVAGLPRRMWKEAADKLNDAATRKKLVDQCMRATAIHEMGHACSLEGHCDKSDPTKELPIGNATCPMRYSDQAQDQLYVVLQILLKPDAALPMSYGQFCKDADFNCWGHLNVKDN